MSHYDSDGSTLVNGQQDQNRGSRHHGGRSPSPESHASRRHRNYGYDDSYPRQSQPYYYDASQSYDDRKSKYAKIAAAAVAVGVVGVLLHKWQKEKNAEREREYRHRRRKDFESAKRRRRREEERREREEERDDSPSPQREVRRIEYRPRSRSSSESSSSSRRGIEAPPARSGRGSRASEGRYEDERRPRSRYQD